jgi:MFS family permease
MVSTTFWPLAIFGFVFGSAYGGWVALLPAVVMDHFGGRNVSGIIGILYTSAGIGTMVGPSAAGFAFDASHSYTLPILVSIGGNVIAAGLMMLVAGGGHRRGERLVPIVARAAAPWRAAGRHITMTFGRTCAKVPATKEDRP